MRRVIIQGIEFDVETRDDEFEVLTWHHNGVLERSIRPTLKYTEVFDRGAVHGDYRSDLDLPSKELTDYQKEELRLKSLKKSAQRAKTACRRMIINCGLMEMLTITYRQNQTDLELAKKHFKEWVRRMKKALGGQFTYVAAFERQERGAMHVHCAVHKLPQHAQYKGTKIQAWRLGTNIWRDIVGENNGLVFVGGKSKTGAPRRNRQSLAAIASYVSKYIMKDFEQTPAGLNRYSRSDVITLPKPERIVLQGSFADILCLSFEVPEGYVLRAHSIFGYFKDCCWQVSERIKR